MPPKPVPGLRNSQSKAPWNALARQCPPPSRLPPVFPERKKRLALASARGRTRLPPIPLTLTRLQLQQLWSPAAARNASRGRAVTRRSTPAPPASRRLFSGNGCLFSLEGRRPRLQRDTTTTQ